MTIEQMIDRAIWIGVFALACAWTFFQVRDALQ